MFPNLSRNHGVCTLNFRSQIAILLLLLATPWLPNFSISCEAQIRRGMVWDPPGNILRAQATLLEMKESGVEVIRMPMLLNSEIYQVADSLGLQIYQDLPLNYLPAGALIDTLEYARQLVREAVSWAGRHTSVRHFGLGRFNDTSNPQACHFFDEVIKEARRYSQKELVFYYSTTFVEDEQCSASVDVIMLDALNEANASMLIERWQASHGESRIGLGALGTWIEAHEVDKDGYKLLQSPAYQARYLENNLNDLLWERDFKNLEAVFVYRWNDIRLEYPSISHNLSFPYQHTYGLKTNRGTNRAAYHVVKGIFTGKQRVFAFTVGQEGNPDVSWIVLLGWFTIALLGIGYAYFPRFSPNVKRYFAAHGFYKSAVEEGRELLFGPTALLLLIIMISFGIAGTVILDTVRVTEAFSALVRWLPPTPRTTLVALLSKPLIMTLIVGSSFAVAVTLWTSILSAVTARNRRRLMPGQTFMLVVWPQWPVIVAMIAAVVISTLDKTHAPIWALALFIILIFAVLIGAARALHDFSSISRPSPVQAGIAFLGNPFFLILMTGLYICVKHADKFSFFWHLIIRT